MDEDRMNALREQTQHLLVEMSPEARATVNRIMSDAVALTGDPHKYRDNGRTWVWTLSQVLGDGAVSAKVWDESAEGGRPVQFRIELDGKITRGTPWLRRRAAPQRTPTTIPEVLGAHGARLFLEYRTRYSLWEGPPSEPGSRVLWTAQGDTAEEALVEILSAFGVRA